MQIDCWLVTSDLNSIRRKNGAVDYNYKERVGKQHHNVYLQKTLNDERKSGKEHHAKPGKEEQARCDINITRQFFLVII